MIVRSTPKSISLFVALVVVTLVGVGWPAVENAPRSTWASAGVRMSVPEGWSAIWRGGERRLSVDPDDPAAGEMRAVHVPEVRGNTIDELEASSRARIDDLDHLRWISSRPIQVAGREALRVDYVSRPSETSTVEVSEALRFGAIVVPRTDTDQPLVLLGQSRGATWDRVDAALEDSARTLRILPR